MGMQASTRRQHLETGVLRELPLYERKARSTSTVSTVVAAAAAERELD